MKKLLFIAVSILVIPYDFLRSIKKLMQPDFYRYFGSQTIDKEEMQLAKNLLKNLPKDTDKVDEFEDCFKIWNGSEFAVSFISARVALNACIYALGLRKGDHVILPGFTCVAVPNSFWYDGIIVDFCDIELESYGPSLESIKNNYCSETKAIVVQHLFGLVCRDYEKIIKWARSKKLFIIEDCAQSTGAKFKNIKVGNLGDCAIYSLEQSKVISTFTGGVATSNNPTIGEKLKDFQSNVPFPTKSDQVKLLKSFLYCYYTKVSKWRYINQRFFKYWFYGELKGSIVETEKLNKFENNYLQKYPECLASLALLQMKKVDNLIERRRENALKWNKKCKKIGLNFIDEPADNYYVFLRLPLYIEDLSLTRKDVKALLKTNFGDWFTSNLHPVKYDLKHLKNSEKALNHMINLPTL